jgi:hypothetical protein
VSRGSDFLSPCDGCGSGMSCRQRVPQRASACHDCGCNDGKCNGGGCNGAAAVRQWPRRVEGEVKGRMTSCQPHKRQLAGYASCPTDTRLFPATTTHSFTLLPSLPVYMPSSAFKLCQPHTWSRLRPCRPVFLSPDVVSVARHVFKCLAPTLHALS